MAFANLFAQFVKDGAPSFDGLTDADRDAIAEYSARTAGVDELYREPCLNSTRHHLMGASAISAESSWNADLNHAQWGIGFAFAWLPPTIDQFRNDWSASVGVSKPADPVDSRYGCGVPESHAFFSD